MNQPSLGSVKRCLSQLEDDWTRHNEHSAFVCEAAYRLLQDHPNLAPDVIQGVEQQVRQLRLEGAAFGQQLTELRDALGRKNGASGA